MKKANSGQFFPYTRTRNETLKQACPQCPLPCWLFSDGSILCPQHHWFDPEPIDRELYLMRERFDIAHGISHNDRLIARVVATIADGPLTEDILREAVVDGLDISAFEEAVRHGFDKNAFTHAYLLGLDCRSLSSTLEVSRQYDDWSRLTTINELLQSWCQFHLPQSGNPTQLNSVCSMLMACDHIGIRPRKAAVKPNQDANL